MVHGDISDGVIVVEADDAWMFSSEINGILMTEPLFCVDATYVDAHKFKAILLRGRDDRHID